MAQIMKCQKCGKPTETIRTHNGQIAQVDPDQIVLVKDAQGQVAGYDADGRLVRGRQVGEAYDGPGAIACWMPHSAVCVEVQPPPKMQQTKM